MNSRADLVTSGLRLARTHGFQNVSRDMLAREAGCSPSLLSYYWNAEEWRIVLMREAVEREDLVVIAQGLVANHPVAVAAPLDLRRRVVESIMGV